jgi:hypothetical protein
MEKNNPQKTKNKSNFIHSNIGISTIILSIVITVATCAIINNMPEPIDNIVTLDSLNTTLSDMKETQQNINDKVNAIYLRKNKT